MTFESLKSEIDELRLEVTRHPLFYRSWNLDDLQLMMTHHVGAV